MELMKLNELLKPNLTKLFITIILGVLVFLIGIFLFNNPVFLKTGCAPNPGCPYCEICMSWGFPGIINLPAIVLIIPLYLLACSISQTFRRKKESLFSLFLP